MYDLTELTTQLQADNRSKAVGLSDSEDQCYVGTLVSDSLNPPGDDARRPFPETRKPGRDVISKHHKTARKQQCGTSKHRSTDNYIQTHVISSDSGEAIFGRSSTGQPRRVKVTQIGQQRLIISCDSLDSHTYAFTVILGHKWLW